MRWWSLPIVLAFGWFVFTLTPLWALYDLARAVRTGDTAYVERHVNFRTLRFSLVRQINALARTAGETGSAAEPRERIADAALALAVPLVETLVTPSTVIDLLDDGWPQSLDLGHGDSTPSVSASGGETRGLRIPNLGRLLPFYLASEMRGFRTVVMPVSPGDGHARQFRIRLRLRGWTWRLVDIELPDDLRERIAQSLAQATPPRMCNPKP